MSEVFIVATPIGNLGDITFRALETLKRADFILCEDTRVTQKLLNHFGIRKPTISYHQHSKLQKLDYILELLRDGKNLALATDAGTPGISDPGNLLVAKIIERFGQQVKITPIPGPSALSAIVSVAGCPMDKFLFLGFPPHKRKRQKFFKEVADSKYPVIFYESPHRISKTLKELNETMKQCNNEAMKIVIGRELTKKFETIYRGNIEEVIKQIEKDKIRGEFVIIVKKYEKQK